MDWFTRVTGFAEGPYSETQARLCVSGDRLHIPETGRNWGIGRLEIASLAVLRSRVQDVQGQGSLKLSIQNVDVGELHARHENRDALFQVASQFNLLEMTGPEVTPEDGVTRYQHDHTQGPACAIAAGAGTIYRNYLMPFDDGFGQTAERQVDCLTGLGFALGNDRRQLWKMRNGYALCSQKGLDHISKVLAGLDEDGLDRMRGLLKIGLHWDVEVTQPTAARQFVSQAYCSALPVAYSTVPVMQWAPFATLTLEAAYEATMLAGVINRQRTGCSRVFLTRLGGGAFGNPSDWIDAALARALTKVRTYDLDVQLITLSSPGPRLRELASEFR